MKARVQRLSLSPGRRILAVSDIHGNLPYFKGLLEKVNFSHNDVLFIVGDMLEKGPESLNTLRYIMELCENYDVYPVCGNCDSWYRGLNFENPDRAGVLINYINEMPHSTISQMCEEIGIAVNYEMDVYSMRDALNTAFAKELEFLSGLPTIIDTEYYTFVHGGLPEGELTQLDAHRCMKNDNFMNQGRILDKWCIVGHWPVVLYGDSIINANPIIDRNSRIISIDGGCVLKDDGQLNALIIPEYGSEEFSWEYYDPFPVYKVEADQEKSDKSCYIRWGDNLVQVLERGEEFSLCKHVRTGYELEILTKYLYSEDEICRCNDCTDYILPLKAGDEVSVVESTSHGSLVKHCGISGWYKGELLPV